MYSFVCVPTPIYPTDGPDLRPCRQLPRPLVRVLTPGAYRSYESTVYPGRHRGILWCDIGPHLWAGSGP